MTPRVWTSALFVGCVALGTAACGSSDPDAVDDTVAEGSVLPAAPTVPGEPDAAAALAQALGELGDSTGSYRVVGYSAQVNRIPAAGIDIEQQIDPTRPTSVGEVDADGDVHATLDLSAMFAGMGGPAGALDQIGIETWQNSERAVIDTEDYAALLEIAPSADLGPFAPGVFTVDLSGSSVGTADFARLMGASAPVSPADLANVLQNSLTDVAGVPGDPARFTGTTDFATFVALQGNDIAAAAAGAATGLAPMLGADPSVVTEMYVDFYETTTVDIEFAIGAGGAVESVHSTADLSGIYAHLAESDLIEREADREQIVELFSGAETRIEQLVQFEFDDSIAVELPTGDFEDRTVEMVEMFAAAGVLD